ncbi:hypothetical protein DL769_001403 [Monosporascus sp. CRB-8-3]|nr:hypothetical protein DL769_001403 [Monosporascus sp. CRB-8-3]
MPSVTLSAAPANIPCPYPRCWETSGVAASKEHRAALATRDDPPTRRTNVDIGETRREQAGETLYTEGLKTCIAVVVRSRDDVAAGNWDKILAHISSNLCQDEDIPGLDEQLNNLFTLDAQTDIPNRQVFVIQAPTNGNEALQAFNDYVFGQCVGHWGQGNVIAMWRDQSKVDQPGGSRLWINGEKRVYWGADGDLIIDF